ncbi:MAG: tetratricopeptide repeat protein [Anaerolineales bacterium]
MTENETPTNSSSVLFNTIVAVAVAVIALVGSLITKVESDASSFSDIAGNDEQIYYYQSMGKQISGDANTNYEFGTIYQLWSEYNLLVLAAKQGGDEISAASYLNLRDQVAKNSTLLSSTYFDSTTGRVDLAAYKADTYGLDVIQLQEMRSAATDVSDAWGDKDSTYVLQLTLLAVAGFLLGLALMTKSNIARLIFVASGIPLVVIISVWAYLVWKEPVFDLRTTDAIPAFAKGASLASQKRWADSISYFDQAIEKAGSDHPYGRAYLYRAQANAELGNYEAAVHDYQFAIDSGETDPNVIGSLVWALFQTGEFQQAVETGQVALEESPDNLWLQLRVGLAMTANGDVDAAKKQYQAIIDLASKQVAEKRALGDDPSDVWWQLNDAAFQLTKLAQLIQTDTTKSPIKSAMQDSKKVLQSAQEFASILNESSVSLQYAVPNSEVKAVFSEPEISLSKTADQAFVYGVDAVFQYSDLEKGQLLTIKVLRNGIEDPSWTINKVWDQVSAGTMAVTLTPSYSDLYVTQPGIYQVVVYVNGQLIQKSAFDVPGEVSPSDFVFSDMLDSYDFSNLDIFADEDGNQTDLSQDPAQLFESGNTNEVISNGDLPATDESGTSIQTCTDPNDPACASVGDPVPTDSTGSDTGGDPSSENP